MAVNKDGTLCTQPMAFADCPLPFGVDEKQRMGKKG